MDEKSSRVLKGICYMVLVIIGLIVGSVLVINFITRPTPDHKRNVTDTDAKIRVDFSDSEEIRKPIIRSYRLEEYQKFDDKKIEKIMDTISGNIEGDIPAVHLKDDNDIIYITFLKDEKLVKPDSIPEIEIEVPEESADTAPYSEENKRIINDKLEDEDGRYSFKIKRYRTQYEKYFLDYNIIKIYYKLDGEEYISLFGLNASNADEGTDFFENEMLKEPIQPEV